MRNERIVEVKTEKTSIEYDGDGEYEAFVHGHMVWVGTFEECKNELLIYFPNAK